MEKPIFIVTILSIFSLFPVSFAQAIPNQGFVCEEVIERDFSLPTGILINKRPPTQILGGIYEIHNNAWPPDTEVITGFYRVGPDGKKFVHNAPTILGVEERWFLYQNNAFPQKAYAQMLGWYDCGGRFLEFDLTIFTGEVFDGDVYIFGTGNFSQQISGTFVYLLDQNGNEMFLGRPFGLANVIFGFVIYAHGEGYDHFVGYLSH